MPLQSPKLPVSPQHQGASQIVATQAASPQRQSAISASTAPLVDDPQHGPGQQVGALTLYGKGLSSTTTGNITTFSDGTTAIQQAGGTTYYSDGTTSQKIGNITRFSDGSTANQVGNTIIYSSGTIATQTGDYLVYSDGRPPVYHPAGQNP